MYETADDLKGKYAIEDVLKKAQNHCGGLSSLMWLESMVIKAEEDRVDMLHKGQYIGIISTITMEDKKLFNTNFGLGSGGLSYHLFDCSGYRINETLDPIRASEKGRDELNIIYSSL